MSCLANMDLCRQRQRAYKAAGIGNIVVGDENYGEGQSAASMLQWSRGILVFAPSWSKALPAFMKPI